MKAEAQITSFEMLTDLKTTCQSTQQLETKPVVAVVESFDGWQQELSADRAILEDLSLKKKKIRLKTVERTFGMIEEIIKLEDNFQSNLNAKNEIEKMYSQLEKMISVIKQNVIGLEQDSQAKKRICI